MKKIILTIIIAILLGGNIYLASKFFNTSAELEMTKALVEEQRSNMKVVNFSRLFVEEVLQAEAEVDFETRLQLENAVRDLKDEEILAQWEKFVNSAEESQAQEEVKNLLGLLVNKMAQ